MNYVIEERLYQFKEDLNAMSPIQIVRKHIISGECCILSQHEYFDLRSEIADHFGVHPNEVLVVGSAKLGFSVAPKKRYLPFGDKSDIDVALVSSKLFDQVCEEIYTYKQEAGDWKKYNEYLDYLFHGWIRPDMLPRSPVFPFGKKWWDFFLGLTSNQRYGDYKIRGAVYKSYYFLENYQEVCVQQCMDEKSINNLEENNADSSRY